MKMVGIVATDDPMIYRRLPGMALTHVRYIGHGMFVGIIADCHGVLAPAGPSMLPFRVREIVTADGCDVWCGRRLVGRRMSLSDKRELTVTIRQHVLMAGRHFAFFFPSRGTIARHISHAREVPDGQPVPVDGRRSRGVRARAEGEHDGPAVLG